MISRLGHAVPRLLAGTNIAGEGMRERLQAATFALFGMVTAVGLVLVGIAYNQGWPDFADSPIPGIPIEHVGKATIAADAAHAKARSGIAPASHGSAPAAQTGVVPDRSSGPHSSPQQQLPATAPGGPGPAPSGPGGVDTPGSPTPTPASHQPAAAAPAPVEAQPTPDAAPVAASPPAAEPADAASVPGNGKAKGHEKTEKTEKPHGKAAPVTPVVPVPPSVPAPGAATPETSGPAPGPGNGHGKGHDK
jgi:hypothetical protein